VRLAGAAINVMPAGLQGHRTGDTVKLALRPELLYVHPTGAPAENTLTGVVENVAFLGAVARIHLNVGGTTVLVDEFNNPQLSVPAIGSTLTTYFTPESCMVLG
jgi:putative spermidine/putrescine transport system ATP-binding protein